MLVPQVFVILDDAAHHIQQRLVLEFASHGPDHASRNVLVESSAHRPPAQRPAPLLQLLAFQLRQAPRAARPSGLEVVFRELSRAVFNAEAQQPRSPICFSTPVFALTPVRHGDGVEHRPDDVQHLRRLPEAGHAMQKRLGRLDIVGGEHLGQQITRDVLRTRQRRQRERGARHGPPLAAGLAALRRRTRQQILIVRRLLLLLLLDDDLALRQRRAQQRPRVRQAHEHQPTRRLDRLQQHDDAPPRLLAAPLRQHLQQQFRVLHDGQAQRCPPVRRALLAVEPRVPRMRCLVDLLAVQRQRHGARQQGVVVQREQLHRRVERLGGDFGLSEATYLDARG
nr:hypothetical protein CFP56_28698 [Quercus suber]